MKRPGRTVLIVAAGLVLAAGAAFVGVQAARGTLCIPLSTNNVLGLEDGPFICLYAPP